MAPTSHFLIAFVAVAQAAQQLGQEAQNANPIRKVVKMLQGMQKTIAEEGEAEKAMYKKYMCYCDTNGKELEDSIAAAETKVPALGTEIEEAEGKKAQLDEDVKQAQSERAAAKQAMLDATAIREKEAAAFALAKTDLETNIAAINKAVDALTAGAYGTFIQTGAAAILRKLLSSKAHMDDADRSEVLSFLSGSQDEAYAPQSGEVIGILKQLGDQMTADLNMTVGDENLAIRAHEEEMAAKKKEVAALSAVIESKMSRSAELGVSIANMKNDLSDTEATLSEDKQFAEDLEQNCATRKVEWDEIVKTRNEELLAVAETIEILNGDDALDLFKKTLPSPAVMLLQVSGADAARARSLAIIRSMSKGNRNVDKRLDFISLALKGKQAGFEKVIGMIDEMVEILKKEQLDDDSKKEFCNTEFDSTDDKKKEFERSIADIDTAIAGAEESLQVVIKEIASLEQVITELDKSTAEATEQRKSEQAAFTQTLQENSEAKQLLEMAKNRLHKFYNPKLHTTTLPPPMSREDQIYSAFGGADFTQTSKVERHGQLRVAGIAKPPPPPEAPSAYTKKSEESAGVFSMIDLLIKDLDTQMTEDETDEKNAETAYAQLMQDSAEKRVTDSNSLTEKKTIKGDLEVELDSHKSSKASAEKELAATSQYIAQLHAECDWLLQHFDTRKNARGSEIDSLGDAKAVLKGADYSMLQAGSRGNLRARKTNAL